MNTANWGSWQTSTTGIINILMGLYLMYQGHQPEALVAIAAGVQGLRARDNKVTSEQAGAK